MILIFGISLIDCSIKNAFSLNFKEKIDIPLINVIYSDNEWNMF